MALSLGGPDYRCMYRRAKEQDNMYGLLQCYCDSQKLLLGGNGSHYITNGSILMDVLWQYRDQLEAIKITKESALELQCSIDYLIEVTKGK